MFILASSSNRRKKLLKKILKKFKVIEPNIDEKIKNKSNLINEAKRLAIKKAEKIAKKYNGYVLSADTIAFFGKKIFSKTYNKITAKKTLKYLSGKTHNVITAIAIFKNKKLDRCFVEKAKVKMKKLSKKQIEKYLLTQEWKGRAGCYDLSGKGKKLIKKVDGEIETVIGLPLKKIKKYLLKEGLIKKR
jgi:septum formation protein